ncbi:hypothetical protein VKT23_019828 [Stygiomarasmius scandens]|uniref:RBR-type E3 ubiquitin transferase n=1 Tax=Marasmiellus scandens TaxID=2682957 RepID=A0ABR1IPI8_9AGAR
MSLASNSPVTVSYWLSNRLVDLLYRKSREFSVPSRDRMYCPISRCSMFLGSSSTIQTTGLVSIECYSCHTFVCLRCGYIAHPGERCRPSPEEIAETQVRELAEEKEWKTCPGCKQMVERISGCPHMICRCRTHFCYGCGGQWGSGCVCGRPQAQPVATVFTPLPRLLLPPSPQIPWVSPAMIAPREQRESWWDIEEPRVRPSFELPPLQAPPNALAGALNRVTGMARRRLHLDNPISTLRGRSYNPFSAI